MSYLYYNNQIRGVKIMGLDQYAYAKESEGAEEQEELAYWRKHNRLQGYMEKLWNLKVAPTTSQPTMVAWVILTVSLFTLPLQTLSS